MLEVLIISMICVVAGIVSAFMVVIWVTMLVAMAQMTWELTSGAVKWVASLFRKKKCDGV
jgi:hypothetical protein